MSWLSDRTGIHLGNIGAPVGAVLGSFVGMPAAGAALGQGIGALGQGKSIPQAIGQGAATYGVGKVLGPLVRAIPGLPGGTASSGGVGGVADASTVMNPSGGGTPWDQILGAVTGGGGGSGESGGGIDWGSILGNIGGFVKDHGTDLAAGGLATAQAVAAAKASQRAGTLQDKALNLADANWSAGEPLRTQGRTRLLSPVRPDLTSTYTDSTNPFASLARVRRTA